MAYKKISDYGVIGDMHSAALVGLDGSIDWLCFPRFDSPSVFAAILDDRKGGRFRIAPTAESSSSQAYLPDSNVLTTTFVTAGGQARITDFMPIGIDITRSSHRVIRLVEGLSGQVEMECWFEPKLDYARGHTKLTACEGGVVAGQGETRLALASAVPLAINGKAARARFTVDAGETQAFVLQWGQPEPQVTDLDELRRELDDTDAYWRSIVAEVSYQGYWRDVIARSLLTLHLLVYAPSGAIVAAVTASLPEYIGGERNWDYRFCWVRDAAYTLDVLNRLNHYAETLHFVHWLNRFYLEHKDEPHLLRPLYPIARGSHQPEESLDHLEGYRASRPVRIGNRAEAMFQLDIFGAIVTAFASYHQSGGVISPGMWLFIQLFVDAAAKNWQLPDRSIWEVRGEPRHFVFSKVMCWLALDRGIRLAESLGVDANTDHWRRVRDEIHADVLKQGWSQSKGAFVQYYGSENLDASLLLLPMIGFISAADPRMLATIEAIRRELTVDGFVRRYLPRATDDGLYSEEGTFTMCTLWLIGCLIILGRLDEAWKLFEKVLAHGNHLGLLSEMIDPVTGEALGNFPQALSHIALIHTAINLEKASATPLPTVHEREEEFALGRVNRRPQTAHWIDTIDREL